MSDFVELFSFVLKQRDGHVGENPGKFKKYGAVFDVLPRFRSYKDAFSLSNDARLIRLQETYLSLLTGCIQSTEESSSYLLLLNLNWTGVGGR